MTLPSGGDYDLDAGLSGLNFRQELNPILESLLTLNASASLPPATFAFMLRAALDTSPNELQIRNPANTAFLKFAEVTDTAVRLFSEGGAVPSLGVSQIFTQPQTIDTSAVAGSLSIGSDQSAGVVARIPLFGHNSLGNNITGVNLVCRVNTNTATAEDFSFEIEVIRGGSTVTVAVLGSLSDFRRSGGGGILDADTLRQAGVELGQIIREAVGRLRDGSNFTASFEPVQTDEGKIFRFNGTSNVIVTLSPKVQHTVMYFLNESSTNATITFQSHPTLPVEFRTTRLTLPGISGQSPMCSVYWFLSGGNRVNIIGNNT